MYFQTLFFFLKWKDIKILKVSGHMMSYICISKFVNKTRTGKLPSFAIAGRPSGFVNNDGAEALEAFVRG